MRHIRSALVVLLVIALALFWGGVFWFYFVFLGGA